MNQTNNMNKDQAIIAAKTFRKEADELLQRMKDHKSALLSRAHEGKGAGGVTIQPHGETFEDINECIAQHILSIRDLESCIMRQGMALKYIGNPNPYPDSKDPTNTIVNPTSDGLKM